MRKDKPCIDFVPPSPQSQEYRWIFPFNADRVLRPPGSWLQQYEIHRLVRSTLHILGLFEGVGMATATTEQRKSWPPPNYMDPDNLNGLIIGFTVPAIVLAVICK